jgi:pimeloyl-ACP methyl ester carboxylesterase
VLLIHPGIFADWFVPLLKEPALTARYRLVRYHRAGCAGSGARTGPPSLSSEAAHARMLAAHLGIARAHVVGHSSSGNVALQLALDAPDFVHTLGVFEPALMSVASVATSRGFVGAAVQRYRAGDAAGAIDVFLAGTCGPGYRAPLDRALSNPIDRYAADAATFFEHELPALQRWTFGPDEGRRITQPVLAVVGERSLEYDPIWGERHQALLECLPHVEPFVLPGATHLLQVEKPTDLALRLAAFFSSHPMNVAA